MLPALHSGYCRMQQNVHPWTLCCGELGVQGFGKGDGAGVASTRPDQRKIDSRPFVIFSAAFDALFILHGTRYQLQQTRTTWTLCFVVGISRYNGSTKAPVPALLRRGHTKPDQLTIDSCSLVILLLVPRSWILHDTHARLQKNVHHFTFLCSSLWGILEYKGLMKPPVTALLCRG